MMSPTQSHHHAPKTRKLTYIFFTCFVLLSVTVVKLLIGFSGGEDGKEKFLEAVNEIREKHNTRVDQNSAKQSSENLTNSTANIEKLEKEYFGRLEEQVLKESGSNSKLSQSLQIKSSRLMAVKEEITALRSGIENLKFLKPDKNTIIPENTSPELTSDADLMYQHPKNPYLRGRPFSGLKNEKYLKIYQRYLNSKEVVLTHAELKMPQVMTGISENHFLEHNLTIQTMFEFWPNGTKCQIWDLGLSVQNVAYLKAHPEKYIYRKFNFEDYPALTKWYPAHAFKIFAIMECLIEFQACVWVDSSIRWRDSPLPMLKTFGQIDLSPFFFFIQSTWHDSVYASHPDMLAYFPSNTTRYLGTSQAQSGAMVIWNTHEMKHKIMKYAVACTLTPECIYPDSPMRGDIKKKSINDISVHFNWHCGRLSDHPKGTPYVCHRDDQTLFDILVRNFNGFDEKKFKAYSRGCKGCNVANVDRGIVREWQKTHRSNE